VKTATERDPLDAVLCGHELPWVALGSSPDGLLDTCAAREVSALLYHRLAGFTHVHDWPEAVRRALARTAHLAAAIEIVRSHEIAAVLEALASCGIHPILLKGAALAHVVYDSPALRPHADTDLLIRRRDVDAVRAAMREIGYSESLLSDGELIFCQFQMIKRDRFAIDHVFDFHWKISMQSLFADALTYDELAAGAVPVPALGGHARTAAGVPALLLACIHPVMHHRNDERFIWLYDIHLLASRLSGGDLERFARLAIDKQMAAICARQLGVTAARFGTAIPDRLMADLSERAGVEPSAAYLEPSRRWHHELAANLGGLPRLGDRVRLLREVLFPGRGYMLTAYGLAPWGSIFLPALYLHRCARGLWKVLAGEK
jgi:hypothetical protein